MVKKVSSESVVKDTRPSIIKPKAANLIRGYQKNLNPPHLSFDSHWIFTGIYGGGNG